MAKIKVTQIRSGIDRPGKHKRVLESLGLRRHQTSRVHEDTPVIRGMVAKIPHLVRVEPVGADEE
ncbi:MAG TPA: 50S ribosomal protein L30 [Candidatus Krumholzibacteria bacterium]|nr:50S ribosomal protein L30 [Candidatus Krumholzibacteria bacterium]